MGVWMANKLYGLDFQVEGRKYGEVQPVGFLFPWRRKLYAAGMRAIDNPHVSKWGLNWDKERRARAEKSTRSRNPFWAWKSFFN